MLFGESSGQKSLKLKMDKMCRPGPFRMTRPNYYYHHLNYKCKKLHLSEGNGTFGAMPMILCEKSINIHAYM